MTWSLWHVSIAFYANWVGKGKLRFNKNFKKLSEKVALKVKALPVYSTPI
jgi:hypothetical protein